MKGLGAETRARGYNAFTDLDLACPLVVFNGEETFPLNSRVDAIGFG